MAKRQTIDPAQQQNEAILADRLAREEAKRPVVPDLGLDLKEKQPENAAEFLADEWDRKAFGDAQPTIKRVIYGPDPLVDQNPAFHEALERYGLVDYAEATAELIRTKGHLAVPDVMMQRGLRNAIAKFGRDAVAEAFRERVLRIPFREVEIDASDEYDPDILGSSVLAEVVHRNERPGMAYKFFSQAAVDRLGWGGYTPVRKPNGDIETAGTLMLGEITLERAEAKRRRVVQLAKEEMDGLEDRYQGAVDRVLSEAGSHIRDIGALKRGDVVRADASEEQEYLGQSRKTGVTVERYTG